MYKNIEKTKNRYEPSINNLSCSNCNNKNLYEDNLNGCIVCTNCGLVAIETLFSYKNKPLYENKSESEQNGILSKIYKSTPIVSKDIMKLEPSNRKDFVRIVKSGNNYNTEERKNIELSDFFSTLSNDMNLDWNFYHSCMQLYFKLLKTGFLKNKLSLLIAGGIMILVSNKLKKPLNIEILTETINFRYQPRRKITKGKISRFKEELTHILDGNENIERFPSFSDVINIDIKLIRENGLYTENEINKLQILSQKLQLYFKEKNVYGSKVNYPVGIIYLASKLLKMEMTFEKLGSICKKCSVTIKTYYNELKNVLPEKYKELL